MEHMKPRIGRLGVLALSVLAGCSIVLSQSHAQGRPSPLKTGLGQDFASETAQRLQPAGMIVGIDEQLEVLSKLVMVVVVVALYGGVLDGAVHPLDLAIGPWMVRFCVPMFDAVLTTDLIATMDPIACRAAI